MNSYAMAFKVGRELGVPDMQTWDKIHKIEKKHGIWQEAGGYIYGYKKKTIDLSGSTKSGILKFIKNTSKIFTIKDIAKREKVNLSGLKDFLYHPAKRLYRGTLKCKALQMICERHGIEWEEE